MALYATRYARAFADVVTGNRLDPAAVMQQLKDFSATVDGSGELREVLENPSFPQDQKLRVLDAIGARVGFEKCVRDFLAVLIGHDRLSGLNDVIELYGQEIDSRLGVLQADVLSARVLGGDERIALEASIGKLAGGKVQASFREDKTLLGGVVVKIGSTVYDGSVRGRLEALRDQLVGTA